MDLKVQKKFSEREHSIIEKTLQEYNLLKEELKNIWGKLPKAAVQGDFSTNNIMLSENSSIQALIDFNIAGDDVLVSDMITQGIFIAYILDLDSHLTENDRKPLFEAFVSEYRSIRKLNNLEESVIDMIYRVVFPFLWSRIDELEELIDADRNGKVLEVLLDNYSILSNSYFVKEEYVS